LTVCRDRSSRSPISRTTDARRAMGAGAPQRCRATMAAGSVCVSRPVPTTVPRPAQAGCLTWSLPAFQLWWRPTGTAVIAHRRGQAPASRCVHSCDSIQPPGVHSCLPGGHRNHPLRMMPAWSAGCSLAVGPMFPTSVRCSQRRSDVPNAVSGLIDRPTPRTSSLEICQPSLSGSKP
jgi:hypothetical protein